MDVLRQQVRRARRRLSWQQFLAVLTWCLTATLLAAAVVIAVDKFYPLGFEPWVWACGAVGLGVVAAAVWALLTRRGELDAAIEIDRRFGLKERVSSSYSLAPAELESAAGRALIEDAVKRVERLHIADQFRVKPNRWAWLPLVPAALAFLLALFLNPAVGENPAGGSIQTAAQRKQVKNSTEALRKKLIERRKTARDQGLKDAEKLFEKLEQGSRRLAKADIKDRKQALVELNDLAKDLEKRRQQLGGSEKLNNLLKQLKDVQKGPGEKLADAMRKGDFDKAQKELKKLAERLKQGKLDEKAKAELSKQLSQMQNKLREMTETHRKLQEDLKKQINEARAAGKSKEADELQRQLAKLAQQSPQMKQLQKMAEQLGQCSKCMQQGDQAGAMAALDSIESELAKMQDDLDELAMLEAAMDEISQAKDSMNCKQCNGQGCAACNGGDGNGNGDGLGRGQGRGARPEEKGKTAFYDTKVKQKIGKGAAVVAEMVDGPNVKGQVEQEIGEAFEAARSDAADPLTEQHLPRGYREHAKKYFDALREGE